MTHYATIGYTGQSPSGKARTQDMAISKQTDKLADVPLSSFRVSVKLRDAIEQEALGERRKRSDMMRILLEEALIARAGKRKNGGRKN